MTLEHEQILVVCTLQFMQGQYTLNARASDKSGREVACINVDLKLEPN